MNFGVVSSVFVGIASLVMLWIASLGFYDVSGPKEVIYPLAVLFCVAAIGGVGFSVYAFRESRRL